MIYINGAPGTGKSTLARAIARATGLVIVHTDQFLVVPHDERIGEILETITNYQLAHGSCIVEGCEVDRLIKHGHIDNGDLLLSTGFERLKPSYASLAARAEKYFELAECERYVVK